MSLTLSASSLIFQCYAVNMPMPVGQMISESERPEVAQTTILILCEMKAADRTRQINTCVAVGNIFKLMTDRY